MRSALLLLPVLLAAACASTAEDAPPRDYTREAMYYRSEPRTILVLPPRNHTTAVDASRLFLSTIGKPLVERGYYVYPPELTLAILHQEGIDAGQSWEIPPDRLHRYLGADAVLYVTISEWDTQYVVVASSVSVHLDYKLVDTRSGQVIWQDERIVARRSGDNVQVSGDALTWLIISTVDATVTALTTDYVPLAHEANTLAVSTLPIGHYNPGYPDLMEAVSAWEAAKTATKEGAEEETDTKTEEAPSEEGR